MSETEKVVVRGDGITLPLLIWRRFRKPMPGLVERTLDINPGLAARGIFLDPGTEVLIPIVEDVETSSEPAARIRLW